MITELLTTLGEGFREVDGGGIGRFSSIHVLEARDGYRIANILSEEARPGAGSDAFVRLLSDSFTRNVIAPNEIGTLSSGTIYWISTPVPYHPQSLQSRLKAAGFLSAREIANIGANVCDELSRLHNQNQLHGGLTPGNIFTGQGQVWLVEAGVQAALDSLKGNSSRLLLSLQPNYLSPEESSGLAISTRSDIFSLGVILYELLTGKLPFGGRTTTTMMATVLTDDHTSSVELGVSSGDSDLIVAAMLRAIEKDPADRWSSAAQFRAALHGSPHSSPTTAPSAHRGCLPTALLLSGSAGFLHYLLS